ncbi:MAG: rhodanese-like domain-containing protein [Anaerolineales bacterium]|nr:rhodanese-like domain-containing protein [Anaerolineales bacterium]
MFKQLFGQRQVSRTAVKQINVAELKEKLDADEPVVLVDVRTPGEYEYDGHIAGSRLIPLSVLTSRTHEIPKDKTIVCVCRSGNRSYTACEMLASQGFTDVINLSGGMIGWRRAGYPHQ